MKTRERRNKSLFYSSQERNNYLCVTSVCLSVFQALRGSKEEPSKNLKPKSKVIKSILALVQALLLEVSQPVRATILQVGAVVPESK